VLPLPAFELHAPRSIGEVLSLLQTLGEGVTLIAGGTDLLPNMKRGLQAPRHLVSLGGVAELVGIRDEGQHLHLGAMTSLHAIARSELVRGRATALGEAAAAVGSPQHRRMGTLGGNLCLDTRCRYYDQSQFWRSALGFCLKKDGDTCHVVPGGCNCVAAASNDTAAAAIALGAVVELVGPSGPRSVAAADFYTSNGAHNTVRAPQELVVCLRVPSRVGGASAYEKLRRRGAIDFPLASVAVHAEVVRERVERLEIVVSALAARPRRVVKAAELAVGRERRLVRRDDIARLVKKTSVPLPNIDGDVVWRREMIEVMVERALARIGLGEA
jgi:4-hydroxybenzoyl-CoA reductase subunit beta